MDADTTPDLLADLEESLRPPPVDTTLDLDAIERRVKRTPATSFPQFRHDEVLALVRRVRSLETERDQAQRVLNEALGHVRHEDDCQQILAVRAGRGLSQGGPGAPCTCGARQCVKDILAVLDTDGKDNR